MSRLQLPSAVGIGMWMARRLWAGRHGVFLNGFWFCFYFPEFFSLGGRAADGKMQLGRAGINPKGDVVSAFLNIRVC